MELDCDDDELGVTADDIAAEAADEPTMMAHAGMWDNFIKLTIDSQDPWAKPEEDTQSYREMRAVRAFNFGGVIGRIIRTRDWGSIEACVPLRDSCLCSNSFLSPPFHGGCRSGHLQAQPRAPGLGPPRTLLHRTSPDRRARRPYATLV